MRWTPLLVVGLFALVIGQGVVAVHVEQIPLAADTPLQGKIWGNETRCYVVHLDANTTREIVYWPKGKLFVHLQPCSGTPHLKASVHGCPSDGATVNWEYQSDKARTDLLAKGQTVTPEWEWIGDIETLSIDLTHQTFYVEVSVYHPPMRSNETLKELGRRFRYFEMDDEADQIDDILYLGKMGPLEVAQLRRLQRKLMPQSSYVLTAHLHDELTFPEERIYPLANTPDWDREITHEKDATIIAGGDNLAGHYLVSFWPPTLAGKQVKEDANASTPAPTAELSATQRRWLEDLVPIHSRRVSDLRHEGPVTLSHLQRIVQEHPDVSPDLAAELELARKAFHPDDIIFDAHPGSPHAQQEHRRRALAAEEKQSKEAAEAAKQRAKALDETNKMLEQMRDTVGETRFEEASARGRTRHASYRRRLEERAAEISLRRSSDRLRVVTNASSDSSPTVADRWQQNLTDADLEYMVYYVDITKDVRARWGVTTNSLLQEFTRLLDSEPREGPLCSPTNPDTTKCGIKQLISRSEFMRIDKDGNGVISRAEYDAEYPDERVGVDDGFESKYNFDKAAANNSETDGIEYATWRNVYDGHRAIFDASVKDPLTRTYWTVCGLNGTGTPIVPSGNVTKDSSRAEWLPISGFERTSEGKLVRTLKGLDDSDNNVYIVNVLVRHKGTNEVFAYKPHVLQRRFPDYEAPEAMDQTGTTIVMAVGITAGVIVGGFCALLVFTKNKAPRPQVKVVKT